MRFQLNARDVIQETVDGEALIIHAPSGTYYSLEGTGEHIWRLLLGGHTPAEIAAAYAAGGDAPAEMTAAIEDFTRELHGEKLLLPAAEASAPEALAAIVSPFSTPVLQKFTDMQELLLVDPIHEIDPHVGWPQRQDPT